MQKADEAAAKVAGTVKGPDKGQAHKDALADAETLRLNLRHCDGRHFRYAVKTAALRAADRLEDRSPYSAAWLARLLARKAFFAVPGLR